jgi:DNA replication protein DnaC
MTPSTCSQCGRTFDREIPADLKRPWRLLLERTPPVCPSCVKRSEAQEEERERERAARARIERVERRRRASGIPQKLSGLSWADVSGVPPRPLAAAHDWGAGELSGLLLSGSIGVGKTHLAAAAAWARLDRGPVRWFSVPVLLAHLELPFDAKARLDALDVLSGAPALVLDDLDKARPTEYAAQQLFCAIDSCVTTGGQLLITTNLELDELATRFPHGQAIVSRLVGYCESFALAGPDRRLERLAS